MTSRVRTRFLTLPFEEPTFFEPYVEAFSTESDAEDAELALELALELPRLLLLALVPVLVAPVLVAPVLVVLLVLALALALELRHEIGSPAFVGALPSYFSSATRTLSAKSILLARGIHP